MNLFDSILKKEQFNNNNNSNSNKTNTQPYIIKPKGKEVGANINEEKKVKIFGDYKSFAFNLQVHGKSIFQNLILSVNAKVDSEMIPVKCKWKRINSSTDIFIKDINSFSYMPTAEDIGYLIEVEVTPLDYPNETAIGQYGPIEMDKDMKDTVELLLTNGNTQFSVNVFDTVSQERLPDKEIKIYLNSDELMLVDVKFDNENTILEQCKYLPLNPVIKINPCDPTRFVMKFFTFEYDDLDSSSSSKVKQKNKREYDLIALSKQCRELIYLIIQFFIIDEKLKNNKLFSLVNYNTLPSEIKVGVTDLIGELKTLKEENKIMMTNMKYLERINRKINEEYKDLEEDFQVTLQKINASDMEIREDIENNIQKSQKNNSHTPNSLSSLGSQGVQWKNKYNELMQIHASLSAKEKALREEIKDHVLKEEINKNLINKKENEIKDFKSCINKLTDETSSLNQTNTILNDKNNKMKNDNKNLSSDNQALKNELDLLKTGKDRLSVISTELETLKKEKESVKYDNQNLIVQRNLLTKQKNDLSKTFEEIRNKKETAEKALNKRNEEYEAIQLSLKAKDKIVADTLTELDKAKKDFKKIQKEYNALKEEHLNMTKPLDTSQMSIMSSRDPYVKIQRDEYEEYDQLKRGQDETEAMILQLKANNESQAAEISKLKLIIEKYENH